MFSQNASDMQRTPPEQIQPPAASPPVVSASLGHTFLQEPQNGIASEIPDLQPSNTYQNGFSMFGYRQQFANETENASNLPSNDAVGQNVRQFEGFVNPALSHTARMQVNNTSSALRLPVPLTSGTVHRHLSSWNSAKTTHEALSRQEYDGGAIGDITPDKQPVENGQGQIKSVQISPPGNLRNDNEDGRGINASEEHYSCFLFRKPMKDLDPVEIDTARLFPIPQLWNTKTSQLVPQFTTFESLTSFLQEDTKRHHTLYVGQDHPDFINIIVTDFSRPKHADSVRQCLEQLGLNQRVPIFNPRSHHLDPSASWPLLQDYSKFIQQEHRLALEEQQRDGCYRLSARRRLFSAAKTSTLGFRDTRAKALRAKWRRKGLSQKRKTASLDTNPTSPNSRRVRQKKSSSSPSDKVTNSSIAMSEKEVESSRMQTEGSRRPKRKVRRNVLYPTSVSADTGCDSVAEGDCSDNEEIPPCAPRENDLGSQRNISLSAHSSPDFEVEGSVLNDFLHNDLADGDLEVPEHMATASQFIDYIPGWSAQTTPVDITFDKDTHCELNHSMLKTGFDDEDKDNFSDRSLFAPVGNDAPQMFGEGLPLEPPVSPVRQNAEIPSQKMPLIQSSEVHGCTPRISNNNDRIDIPYHQPLLVDRRAEQLGDKPPDVQGNTLHPRKAYETRIFPASKAFAPPGGKKPLYSKSREIEKNADIHHGPASHSPKVPENVNESPMNRQIQGTLKRHEIPPLPTQTSVVTTTHVRLSSSSLETAPAMDGNGHRSAQYGQSKVPGLSTDEGHTPETSGERSVDHNNDRVLTTVTEDAGTTHLQSSYRALGAQIKLASSVDVALPRANGVPAKSNLQSTKLVDTHSQDELYLWDHQKNARSERPMSIQDAVLQCLRSSHLFIYDGQDFDFADNKVLALTGLSKKDRNAWEVRGNSSTKKAKVRVWDFRMGCLRTHFRSPAIQRLHPWLQSNPHCTVFTPWLLVPSGIKDSSRESKPCLRENVEKQSSLREYIARRIEKLVLQRIRDLRVPYVSNSQLSVIEIWNAFRRRREGARSFKTRRELFKFLFQNPWLEPLYGQDQVSELESTTCNKLVRVSLNSPASVGRFWDRIDNKICDNCDGNDGSSSIGNLLAQKPRYVLYQGQDLACSQSLSKYVSSSVPFRFLVMLKCGANVQESFFSKRWVTITVHPDHHCTSCAVFWNKQSKSVYMQPHCNKRIPITAYLKEQRHMELYIGQDQPEETRRELRNWLEVIQRCRPIEDNQIVLLTRAEFVPSSYTPVALPELTDEPETKAKKHTSTHRVLRTPNERNKIYRKSDHVEGQEVKRCANAPVNGEPKQFMDLETLVERRESAAQKSSESDTAGEMQRQHGHYSQVTAPAEVMVLEPSLCTSIGSDVNSEANSMSPELDEVSQSFEERLRAPARTAARMLVLVKEIGPRILKQELMHDLRQALYENFITEVGSRTELLGLIHDISDLRFVRMAAELCGELESLDVTGCFSATEDVGYGASDLLAVRDDLECGKICTMSEVVRRFRVICQNLIHFNEGFYLEYEAVDLKQRAEEVIHRYMSKRKEVFEAEARLSRLTKICERARRIGFRKPQNLQGAATEAISPAKVPESSKNPRRDRTRVTLLNYRDEKGNSVMGKRHSVRVFGFPIHRQACQRELGGVRPCHVCGCDVFEAEENSLVCSNRFYGGCNECLCKKCLESVTCMESSEFISLRDSQNWICIHCRGLCPAGSSCLVSKPEERAASEHCETIQFSWPYKLVESPLSMAVSLVRRGDNGEFGEGDGKANTFVLSHSDGIWSATLKCRIGVYRALVKANGDWIASTTFYVCSTRHPKEFQTEAETKKSVALRYYKSERPPKNAIVPRGPRVLWKVAEEDMPGSVHAIRKSDSEGENRVITECSRTEGYDWQRAKRHSVLHWRPCPKKADLPTNGSRDQYAFGENRKRMANASSQNVQTIMLSSTHKNHARCTGVCHSPPKLRPGVSHKEFITEWNTFKYDEMLKSLWGIITGRSEIHGIGLFTLTGYQKGDFIIEYAGDLIRTPLADIREARYVAAGLGTYLFKINEQQIVDATVQSNRARFTNHSCDPNMIANIIHVRGRDLVVLQATRDIPKLAELTFDYKLPYEDTKVQCLCNAWNCVGVMN